ncbi:MAG: methylamine utilization protein MauD [Actinomycetia bacterium]|nr:methylamine utilization protein MauD [Actinomycetes bacterium]
MAVGAVVRVLLVAVLAAAVLMKVANGASSRAALLGWGLKTGRSRWAGWSVLVAVETALAVGLAVDIRGAAEAAAVVFAGFALAIGVALGRGRAGAPCGCFGSRSSIGRLSLTRAVVLAAASASVPALSGVQMSTQHWLVVGVLIALVAIAALIVAVLALAREVGELRLSLGPQSALSIDSEGPEIGSRLSLIDRFDPTAPLALAVFSSATCRLCQALAPAIRLVGREPGVALQVFDEAGESDVWRTLAVPGSPYAVVMNDEGQVVSKGTFNTLAQLEGLLAAAERMRAVTAGG